MLIMEICRQKASLSYHLLDVTTFHNNHDGLFIFPRPLDRQFVLNIYSSSITCFGRAALITCSTSSFRGLCATALDWLLKESSATKASLNSLNLKDASWVKSTLIKTLIWIRPPVQPDFSFCHDQCWKIAQLRADFTFKQIKTSSANL